MGPPPPGREVAGDGHGAGGKRQVTSGCHLRQRERTVVEVEDPDGEEHPRACSHLGVVRGEHEVPRRTAQQRREAVGCRTEIRERAAEPAELVGEVVAGVGERPDQRLVGTEVDLAEPRIRPTGDRAQLLDQPDPPGSAGLLFVDCGPRRAHRLDAHIGDLSGRTGKGIDRADLASDHGEDLEGSEQPGTGAVVGLLELGTRLLERFQCGRADELGRAEVLSSGAQAVETGLRFAARAQEREGRDHQPRGHDQGEHRRDEPATS